MAIRIMITGASGFVGRQLVARLGAAGHHIQVAGRDPIRLKALFPGLNAVSYEDLSTLASGCDLLVHCAVANTQSKLNEAEFFQANVDLTDRVVDAALAAEVPNIVVLSTTQALDPTLGSAYARTKFESARRIMARDNSPITIVYMPLVYGDNYAGKLAILNRLPRKLAQALFQPLAALKPSVHIDALVAFLARFESGDVKRLNVCEVILADPQSDNPWYTIAKRIMDVGFSISILVFLGWALCLVWLAVRLQSPGPGIFAQERVGRNGTTFICYKFRTMKQGTRQAGTHEVSAASVTRLGAFLRSTKIDELPQVWNILKNEMSLVGPRPCLPVQHDVISARRAVGVDRLTPGITGLSQINHIDMSEPLRLAVWDARYDGLRSLLFDLKILVATATGRGLGDNTAVQ